MSQWNGGGDGSIAKSILFVFLVLAFIGLMFFVGSVIRSATDDEPEPKWRTPIESSQES